MAEVTPEMLPQTVEEIAAFKKWHADMLPGYHRLSRNVQIREAERNQLRELLAELQWSWRHEDDQMYCFICYEDKPDGHAAACRFAAALGLPKE